MISPPADVIGLCTKFNRMGNNTKIHTTATTPLYTKKRAMSCSHMTKSYMSGPLVPLMRFHGQASEVGKLGT